MDDQVTFTRRHMVSATTAVALTSILTPCAFATPATAWDEFLLTAREKGKALLAQEGVPVDEYLFLLASLASRIGNVPPSEAGKVPWLDPAVSFGMVSKGSPFIVLEWQFVPHAVLPPHNHPNASVCTVGLDGDAVVENFEVTGAAPAYDAKETFRVRRTHRQWIAPRRVNTVAPDRDNIHTFRAGAKGTRGIDITSMHGPSAPFSYLKIEAPVAKEIDVYTARWWKPA
jgi:hypothetical protein